jgi:hypothetical protein
VQLTPWGAMSAQARAHTHAYTRCGPCALQLGARLQAAADALAAASRLTALELLRCVPSVPMNFFDFHSGVSLLRPMARCLRRLKLNDARFLCHARDETWAPLAALTALESLVLSGVTCMCSMHVQTRAPHADVPALQARMRRRAGAKLSWKADIAVAALTAGAVQARTSTGSRMPRCRHWAR